MYKEDSMISTFLSFRARRSKPEIRIVFNSYTKKSGLLRQARKDNRKTHFLILSNFLVHILYTYTSFWYPPYTYTKYLYISVETLLFPDNYSKVAHVRKFSWFKQSCICLDNY